MYQINSQDDHTDALIESVRGRTPKLTNFVPGSLNHAIIDGMYAQNEVERDHATLAIQLSGWIDTAGGPIEPDDLLDIDPEYDTSVVDFDVLNSYMDDRDLESKAAEVGLTRRPGYKATGEIIVNFASTGGQVSERSEFRTETEEDGSYLSFYTTERRSTNDGSTSVRVPIEAADIGPQYNVGAGQINTIPSQGSSGRNVTNPEATDGGENPESNEELRQRVKNNVTQLSGGGTENGIIGRISNELSTVEEKDITLIEHHDPTSEDDEGPFGGAPWGEVVIDAPEYEDEQLKHQIQKWKPFGVGHVLTRPNIHVVDVSMTLVGSTGDIDEVALETRISNYIGSLSLGQNLYDSRIGFVAMGADDDIIDYDDLELVDNGSTVESDLIVTKRDKIEPGFVTVTVAPPPN